MPKTFRLLPIGAEFEQQFMPGRNVTGSMVSVFRYRVVAHDRVSTPSRRDGLAERIEPVALRHRLTKTLTMTFEEDAWGNTIWLRELDGEPPSPTYASALAQIGIDVPQSAEGVTHPTAPPAAT